MFDTILSFLKPTFRKRAAHTKSLSKASSNASLASDKMKPVLSAEKKIEANMNKLARVMDDLKRARIPEQRALAKKEAEKTLTQLFNDLSGEMERLVSIYAIIHGCANSINTSLKQLESQIKAAQRTAKKKDSQTMEMQLNKLQEWHSQIENVLAYHHTHTEYQRKGYAPVGAHHFSTQQMERALRALMKEMSKDLATLQKVAGSRGSLNTHAQRVEQELENTRIHLMKVSELYFMVMNNMRKRYETIKATVELEGVNKEDTYDLSLYVARIRNMIDHETKQARILN